MASSDFIAGIKEAEEKFRSDQLEAFAGIEPDICGMIGVLPFTPQMFIELSGCGNGFLSSEKSITPVDVAVFLWRVNPGFDRKDKGKRQTFNLCVAVLPFDEAVKEIFEYITRSWASMPQWPGGNKNAAPSAGVWPSRLVDMMASEYGWQDEYILNLPYRRLFQYANRIMERKDSDYTHKCPETLRLRQKWLDEQEAARVAAQDTPTEAR